MSNSNESYFKMLIKSCDPNPILISWKISEIYIVKSQVQTLKVFWIVCKLDLLQPSSLR